MASCFLVMRYWTGAYIVRSRMLSSQLQLQLVWKMKVKTYSGALGDGGILLSAHHLNMSGMSLVGYSLERQQPIHNHCQGK